MLIERCADLELVVWRILAYFPLQQMDPRHPYEQIPLFAGGLVLAIWLIVVHGWLLACPGPARSFLKKFPRNSTIGQVLMALGMAWFWLLVAPDGNGLISSLAMDLGEFNGIKPTLRIFLPILLVLVVMSIRDFLAVRALGLLGLMAASPLLESAFLEDPVSRLLIPIYAYLLLTASMFCVGMPYLFRDAVNWVTAEKSRWNLFAGAGLLYGVLTLVCTLLFWRGY